MYKKNLFGRMLLIAWAMFIVLAICTLLGACHSTKNESSNIRAREIFAENSAKNTAVNSSDSIQTHISLSLGDFAIENIMPEIALQSPYNDSTNNPPVKGFRIVGKNAILTIDRSKLTKTNINSSERRNTQKSEISETSKCAKSETVAVAKPPGTWQILLITSFILIVSYFIYRFGKRLFSELTDLL